MLSGETPPCGAEPRIELGPALQQADALPTEPRRTIWATPHHNVNVSWLRSKVNGITKGTTEQEKE